MHIPLYKIKWDRDDVKAVTQVIMRGMYWTGGQENVELEREVAGYIGMTYGVSFNSGTSSLTALLLSYGVGPGDEVIVPAFTYPSTVDAVRFTGARPVFADIEEDTYGLDVNDIAGRITDRTKAIIAVHVYGLPCKIKEIRALVDSCCLLLIEDAAEALGADVLGVKAGSFGDAAILSFSGNKIVTTGEGGMALTNSFDIYDKLKQIRKRRSWRMSTIQAALGLSQFRNLDTLLALRRKKAHQLSLRLYRIDGVQLPSHPKEYSHTYQFYTIRVEEGRDQLERHLKEKGISTKIYFPALDSLSVAERVSRQVLTLPMFPELSEKEMDYIAEAVREFSESKYI